MHWRLITLRTLLHLGPNVITFRTLLHLGQLLHLGLQQGITYDLNAPEDTRNVNRSVRCFLGVRERGKNEKLGGG